jgi:hypothetical protein
MVIGKHLFPKLLIEMLKRSEINKTSKLILIINRSEIVRAQRLHEQRILMKNYNAKQVVEK